MTRAGEAFATLTGGAFAGLDQSFYDDDEAKLEACRANGERAPVAHLSEGARDQLYLALRLAYIEDYAARAEAPPFIGDDIFASFDEFPHRRRSRSARGDRRPHSADRVHAPSARHRRGPRPSGRCGRHRSNRLSSRRRTDVPGRRDGPCRPSGEREAARYVRRWVAAQRGEKTWTCRGRARAAKRGCLKTVVSLSQ